MKSKWNGVLVLPELPERRQQIGRTRAVQRLFPGAECSGQIFDSALVGHDVLKTDLAAPYDRLLLRHKHAKRRANSVPVVTCREDKVEGALPERLLLAWDQLGQVECYANTPEKVLESWENRFNFRTEDAAIGVPGLRPPQIGALHAISAHFAVGDRFDAATIVLPTGTGKTETMLATLVYRRLCRTLILVPTAILRRQITEKFLSLGILPALGTVPQEMPRPRVATIEGGIRSVDEARSIVQHSNVIVALPNALNASAPEAADELIRGCTDLIVDEAHHVTAATWAGVREHFKDKRVIQFTATPFRRDGKRIDGKIIFNYKLSDAQKAGYYRSINLHAIEEYGNTSTRDQAVAKKALEVLRNDREELGLNHVLMARARTRAHASDVASIYRELAPDLNPVEVVSGTGRKKANKRALDQILDAAPSGSSVVVCVDMLGEGFDLPNLKIAALHDTHKSIAITLQFIGRFTRSGSAGNIGDASVVTNIADPDAEAKLADLYAEGADWDKIIRRLSEETIAAEIKLQDVVSGLKEQGNLHEQLSLWNLRPTLSGQFFSTSCVDWSPLEFQTVLPSGSKTWYALNNEENVLVAVVCRSSKVSWGRYQNLRDTIYDLVLMRWDQSVSTLSLYASNYGALNSERMARAVSMDTADLIAGPRVFNILNNVELPLVKSLGSSRIGAISFTSYFGPNVTDGLASIEKAESALNNIACLGYEDGERVLWGGTQRRGKIWQQQSGTISEWIEWTTKTWRKISVETESEANITRDFLRPTKMDAPHDSLPISVQWGEQVQMRLNDRQWVIHNEAESPLFMIDLGIGGIGEDNSIHIDIFSETSRSRYQITISKALSGGYQYQHLTGPTVCLRIGSNQRIPLEEYVQKDPLIIRYADGTHSYNCYHIPTNINAGAFNRDRIETWDWSGIALNRESMHKSRNTETIQYRAYQELRDDYDLIFNDDGCGEAADLVCLRENTEESTIQLCLVHCKGAIEGRVSSDIRNFYTVCGQAQKCITAKHAGLPRLYKDLKRRHEAWSEGGASRFLKGDLKKLAYFKDKSRRSRLSFEVIVVQPGASAQSVTDDILRLLGTTDLYLVKTTNASFRVVLSP